MHPHDLSPEDSKIALAASDRPELLQELIATSRQAFGFFTQHFPHTINYAWAADKLDGLPAGTRVLDLGAGVSPLPLFVAQRGMIVDCVDNSTMTRLPPVQDDWNEWGFLDYRQLDERATSYRCDVCDFIPPSPYDVIYSIGVLAHLLTAERERALRNCRNWLRPNGTLLLGLDLVPSTQFLWNFGSGIEFEPRSQHGTMGDLLRELEALGFCITDCRVVRGVHRARSDLLLIAGIASATGPLSSAVSVRQPVEDPVSKAAFENVIAEHIAAVAPALVGIDAEIARAAAGKAALAHRAFGRRHPTVSDVFSIATAARHVEPAAGGMETVKDPLSKAAFERAIAEHIAAVAPALMDIDAEFAPAPADNAVSADLHILQTRRTLLLSGLFDEEFYRETYPDVRESPIDLLTHYVRFGEAQGRSPNPVFFPRYYHRNAMADAPAEQNALEHYIETGEALGRKPNPAFDPQAYRLSNPALLRFVDRPLLHYLKLGRPAGLKPGGRGTALEAVLGAQPHAADFEYSGRRNHFELMRYKQALVSAFGLEEGFAFYKEAFGLPNSERLELKPIASLRDIARDRPGAFHEIAPAGERFVVVPPPVIGEGNHRALDGVSRTIFVACLTDARVRARSAFIEVDGLAVLDYQDEELTRVAEELDFDPAVFHATDRAVWMTEPENEANTIELEEAFTLVGAHTASFGHWMCEYLPQYIAAAGSGVLPAVPILIDQEMPETHRRSLESLLPPGSKIVALPPFATARVGRLWCASSQMYCTRECWQR
jgi:SAM-dependent methyltransferase